MNKLILILLTLSSILFAENIPSYSELTSGKYKFSEKVGYYTYASESTPKMKMIIYSHNKTIVDKNNYKKVIIPYFKFIITKKLYQKLKSKNDYKKFLTKPGEDGQSSVYGLLVDVRDAKRILKDLSKVNYLGLNYNSATPSERKAYNLINYINKQEYHYFFIKQLPKKMNCYGENLSNKSGSHQCSAKKMSELFTKD